MRKFRLKRISANWLQSAIASYEATGEDVRMFHSFMYDPRQSYVRFKIPAIQDPIVDEEGISIPGETIDHTVKVYFDQDGLVGKFTVNAEGKQVLFSRGNLYYDGNVFKFETNQYDVPDSWSTVSGYGLVPFVEFLSGGLLVGTLRKRVLGCVVHSFEGFECATMERGRHFT